MRKVLIVDDDESLCECLLKLMPWEDMQCQIPVIVHNGLNAWELLQKEHFDFIICDIKMPMMEGTELAKLIHQSNIDTKIVFLSAYEDFSAAKKALKYGVLDYILKPLDFECLSSLEELIRSADDKTAVLDEEEVIIEAGGMDYQIKKVIDKNYLSVNCNVAWIADQVQICAAYVGRIFLKSYGVKITEYIINKRMEEACRLLREGTLTVQAISRQVGYQDIHYFTNAFRARIGMSPSEYRKTHNR